MKSKAGMALLQVLLIGGIISILALYISQTSLKQVNMAIKQQGYTQAQFKLHGAKNKILFELLTKERSPVAGVDKISSNWNFYNVPFEVEKDVFARIRDQAGLIDISTGPTEQLENLLVAQGLSRSRTQVIMQSLADWVDSDNLVKLNGAENEYYQSQSLLTPRNGALQSIQELLHVRGMDNALFDKIKNDVTIHGAAYFNPMSASHQVMSSLMDATIAQKVVEKREANNLTAEEFIQMSGLVETDGQYFNPSSLLRLELQYLNKEVRLKKSTLINVTPSLVLPFYVIENSWNGA